MAEPIVTPAEYQSMSVLAFEARIPPAGQCMITSRVQRPFLPLRFQVAPSSVMCRILSLTAMHDEILLCTPSDGISAEHLPVFSPEVRERGVEFVNLVRKPVWPGVDLRLIVESDVQHFDMQFKGAIIGLVME